MRANDARRLDAVFGLAQDQRLDFLAVPDEASKVVHILVRDGVAVVGVRFKVIDVEPVKTHFSQQRISTIAVCHLVGDGAFLVVPGLERAFAHR